MSKTAIFTADGCEEIEALTVVDLLRRADIEIVSVSVNKTRSVTGSHNITFQTDAVFEEVNFDEFDGVILPGGIPGTPNLAAHAGVMNVLRDFSEKKKLIAAICAAPSVLGEAELLHGKRAVCYPGFEAKLLGAVCASDSVVRDENFITSKGMGTAIDFALEIVKYFTNEETASELASQIIYKKV